MLVSLRLLLTLPVFVLGPSHQVEKSVSSCFGSPYPDILFVVRPLKVSELLSAGTIRGTWFRRAGLLLRPLLWNACHFIVRLYVQRKMEGSCLGCERSDYVRAVYWQSIPSVCRE